MAKRKRPQSIQRPTSSGQAKAKSSRSLKLPAGRSGSAVPGRKPSNPQGSKATHGKSRAQARPVPAQRAKSGLKKKAGYSKTTTSKLAPRSKKKPSAKEWLRLFKQAEQGGSKTSVREWYKLLQESAGEVGRGRGGQKGKGVSRRAPQTGRSVVGKGKKRRPVKGKQKNKQVAKSLKSGAIRIGNRTLSPEISNALREMRAKFLKEGKMVTYNWLYRQYNKYAKLSCEPGEFGGYKDPLEGYIDELADQHAYTVFARLNTCKDIVMELRDEAIEKGTSIKLYVKGYFEDKAVYYPFNEGIVKMDDELDITWKAIALYKERYDPPSPLFTIPVCINRLTFVVVVDFNDILVENMDKIIFMNIVREIK